MTLACLLYWHCLVAWDQPPLPAPTWKSVALCPEGTPRGVLSGPLSGGTPWGQWVGGARPLQLTCLWVPGHRQTLPVEEQTETR